LSSGDAVIRALPVGDARPDTHEALLQRALAQDPAAVRALLALLLPVVRARALLACRRNAGALRSGDAEQEVDDLTQEVLVTLFAEDARVLRSWDRGRGLSLRNFVGLVCARRIHQILRAGKQGASPEELTRDGDFETTDLGTEDDKLDVALASRQLFSRILDQLRIEVSARGMDLFHALLIEERSIESVRAEFEMSADAVYAWRSRLLRRARTLARELDGGAPQSDFSPAAAIRMKAGAS
jgi:RNA polymerase sigma-70 factor (ECF subfamily)